VPTTAYCYTCNVHHPVEEMRQIMTGRGKRWRCIKTIEASRMESAKRQEFGARTTANNKADWRRIEVRKAESEGNAET
jgi:hypothetical protein